MNINDIKKTNQYLVQKMPLVLADDLDKIILYGSCARGDFREDSDIDIALLTKCDRLESKKYNDKLLDIVTDAAMDYGTVVQYVCIPILEYNEKKSWYGYFQNIEREGIVIYG
jgi:predicted nucleotidyltransferase